jgi:hypothetical protein
MTWDVKHFFLCFLVIWISSFEKTFQFICPFLHWVVDFFGNLVFGAPYIFWLSILCQMYSWQRFFFHSVGGFFNLEIISFVVQKIFFFCGTGV